MSHPKKYKHDFKCLEKAVANRLGYLCLVFEECAYLSISKELGKSEIGNPNVSYGYIRVQALGDEADW